LQQLGDKHYIACFLNSAAEHQVSKGVQKLWAIDGIAETAFTIIKTINTNYFWMKLVDDMNLLGHFSP